MLLKAFITPGGAVILAVFIAAVIFCGIVSRKARNKLLDEGKIIIRENNFWDKSESFTINDVTLDTVFGELPATEMKSHVGKYEIQPENNRIVFVHNGYNESYTATLRLASVENNSYTYKFMINQYRYKGSRPNELSLNVLYTAVEKIFLKHDSDVKVTSEYVDRKTKKSFF